MGEGNAENTQTLSLFIKDINGHTCVLEMVERRYCHYCEWRKEQLLMRMNCMKIGLDMVIFALTSQFCDLDSPYKLQRRILES